MTNIKSITPNITEQVPKTEYFSKCSKSKDHSSAHNYQTGTKLKLDLQLDLQLDMIK